ncbi:DUF3658 domain-containing protein [Stenotrophomonas sp. PS02289]|uniref:DUF3658 domain-containing protein n=1 Tax=Stenotrophomonas sp. PS02289 TaxID=2991422 RepID=UPI00249CC26F|nr:DUF3658 domain-containing protein [Stenotrophomonas sp. PS02289]
MRDLHIAAGDSAAGSLRVAIATGRMPGEVFSINDDLAIGPLSSAAGRIAFLRTLILPPPHVDAEEDSSDEDEDDDVFARWEALRIRCQVPGRVMLWISGSASDQVLLRMACHALQTTRATLWRVPVPAFEGGHEAVAAHPVDALVRFAPGARPLSADTVATLADEFAQIAARPELLRQCDANGALRYRAIDCHDPMLLDCCPRHWVPANRVIGNAMERCEPRNAMGDTFFAARLRALIDAGRVETRTPLQGRSWSWAVQVRRTDEA